MIADDERMVRLGLKSMLNELYPNRYTYVEAKNGKEMMELIYKIKPDIGFIDIKMPLLDGLSALKAVKEESPDTQWLILSGYADFEYARSALRLGAIEYLLKPIGIEELQKVIQKAEFNLKSNLKSLNSQFAFQIVSFYNMYQSLYFDEIASELSLSDNFKFYIFYVDNWEKTIRNKIHKSIIENLEFYMETKISSKFKYAFIFLSSGELCLVTCGNIEFGSINTIINDILNSNKEPITIFYKDDSSISKLFNECQLITDISSLRSIYGYGKLMYFDNSLLNISTKYKKLSSEIENLCIAFIQEDEIEYKNILNQITNNSECKNLFKIADKDCLKKYFKTNIGIDIKVESYIDFINSLLKCTALIYRVTKNNVEIDIIEQIIEYIKSNYMNDIGINSIAELWDISPNYLSKIFHQRVGKKFIDYLTETRISNAKRIFSYNPNVTVKDVSSQIGYMSTRHFTKTFLKIVGCLPSEYINQIKNKV